MKLLLVEDNQSKRDNIIEIIDREYNCRIHIDMTDNLENAQLKIEENKYDLFILDLSIRSGKCEASIEYGLKLYDQIIKSTKNIIIYSSFNNLQSTERKNQFNDDKISFIDYNTEGPDWEIEFIELIKPLINEDDLYFDVAIINALDDEFDWMQKASNTKWYDFLINDVQYSSTKIRNTNNEEISVVAHSINKMGITYSSAVSTKILMMFQPKFLVMTGICAGLEGSVEKGDIIIPEYVFNYQEGDITETGFTPAFKFKQLDTKISKLIRQTKDSYIFDIKNEWEQKYNNFGKMPAGTFRVHNEKQLGTGSAVVKDEVILNDIKKNNQKDIIGLDMEGYSIFVAAEILEELNTTPILIKAVQDFANKEKDKDYRFFSCFASARYFFRLCEDLLVTKINQER